MFLLGVAVEETFLKLEALLEDMRSRLERIEARARPEQTAVKFEEAAQMLSCSARHISRMVKRGELSLCDVGGMRRISVESIHDLVNRKPLRSSGATRERVKYDAAAASRRLAELRRRR